jgi:hypothetical protein
MEKKKEAFDFELDLLYKNNKNPSEALHQLAKMYDELLTFDKHLLYNILADSTVEYQLVDIEIGSLKTKIVQIFTAIPDDFIKEILNPGNWPGLLLVEIKHRLLKAIQNNEIQDKICLDVVTNDINKEMKKLIPPQIIYLELNPDYILNRANEISIQSSKLKDNESYVFKSRGRTVSMNNKVSIDMPKILDELESKTIEQRRIESLKVKTIELLSDNTKWKLMREGKGIDVKISHKEWLDKYHSRKIVIQPNDYLKVDLKITHITNQNTKKPIVTYEALKVFDVIPPDDIEMKNQVYLFEDSHLSL